jgi:hypothetical protein
VVDHFNHGTSANERHKCREEKTKITDPNLFQFAKCRHAQIHHDEAGNATRGIHHHEQEQQSKVQQPCFCKFRQQDKGKHHQNTTNDGAKEKSRATQKCE